MADEWKSVKFHDTLLNKIKPVITTLDKGLSGVITAINALSVVMNLLQLFINSFGSIMSILQTFITFGRQTIKGFVGNLGEAGLFVNVFVPPAFVQSLSNNLDWQSQSNGGFPGFVSRLKVSLYNTADVNRPVFDSNGRVGGLIFLADAETLDEFFKALNFILGTFDFMDLFPFITSPPPPRNIRATSGYFEQPDKTRKFGIRLEWDAPTIIGFEKYKISRSPTPGGTFEEKETIPTKLVGPKGHEEEGILTAVKIKLFSNDHKWPLTLVQTYKDQEFGGPVYVTPNLVTYGGVYIDYNVKLDQERTYYYVIQSGSKENDLFGPLSPEVPVTSIPKGCIPAGSSDTVEQPNGQTEFLSVGLGPLGMWSSVTAKTLLPFIPVIADLLNNFLDTLEGSLKTCTKSFSDFLKGIVAKFEKYQAMLEAISGMIIALENFFSNIPKIAMLLVPDEAGGVDNFVKRVSNAKQPQGGFSGVSGITMGVVFMWGQSVTSPKKIGEEWNETVANANTTIVTEAMSLLKAILSA